VPRGRYVGGKGGNVPASKFKLQGVDMAANLRPSCQRGFDNELCSRPPRFTLEARGFAFLKVRSPRNEGAKYLAGLRTLC